MITEGIDVTGSEGMRGGAVENVAIRTEGVPGRGRGIVIDVSWKFGKESIPLILDSLQVTVEVGLKNSIS